MSTDSAGSKHIEMGHLLSQYGKMTSLVNAKMASVSNFSAQGVQIEQLFKLQMLMNQLTMFGQTLTNVIQGIQEVALSIARNAKGS